MRERTQDLHAQRNLLLLANVLARRCSNTSVGNMPVMTMARTGLEMVANSTADADECSEEHDRFYTLLMAERTTAEDVVHVEAGDVWHGCGLLGFELGDLFVVVGK